MRVFGLRRTVLSMNFASTVCFMAKYCISTVLHGLVYLSTAEVYVPGFCDVFVVMGVTEIGGLYLLHNVATETAGCLMSSS
jgi:hypothetical protein